MLTASESAAQTGGATLVVGPVNLYPSIVLRDIGVDSNIRNDADIRCRISPSRRSRACGRVPVGATLLPGSVAGFVYYATYKSQQSINRRFGGRFEGMSSRLRPFFAGSFNHSNERAGYEIDARVLRRETSLSAGAEFKLTGITSVIGEYRHSTQRSTATMSGCSERC